MKQKRWKTWHTVGVLIALGLAIAGAAGAFGQTRPASPYDTASTVDTAEQGEKVTVIYPTGERAEVDRTLIENPETPQRGKALSFRQAWEHLYDQSARERAAAPPSGSPISESSFVTYVVVVHALAVVGVVSIVYWIVTAASR